MVRVLGFFIDYLIANWYIWVLICIAGICAVAAEIRSVERSSHPPTPMGMFPATIIVLALFGGCALAAISAYLAAGKYLWKLVAS
jgi:hypothetical protein